MIDEKFGSYTPGLEAPASDAMAITPHNANDLGFVTRGIYVGEAGDIAVEMLSGDVVTLRNAAAGMIYSVRAQKVLATGTTAGDLVALR